MEIIAHDVLCTLYGDADRMRQECQRKLDASEKLVDRVKHLYARLAHETMMQVIIDRGASIGLPVLYENEYGELALLQHTKVGRR